VVAVLCSPVPDLPYQTVDTYNNTYNTTLTFWCDVGYVLFDNTTARTIKCLADGTWSADLPPCQRMYHSSLSLLPPPRYGSGVLRSVCLSVCLSDSLSVREHISGTAGPIFTKCCVQIPRGRGSVLLWQRCDMLCTSAFMNGVTFGHMRGRLNL